MRVVYVATLSFVRHQYYFPSIGEWRICLSGISQLDLNMRSVELSVSKGFLNITPYAGVGHVWGDVTPNVASLQKVSTSADKLFGGLNVNLGLFNVAAEMDRAGKNESYSVNAGFRW